jgi:drug/metabolite transporter (DMT)-like permease
LTESFYFVTLLKVKIKNKGGQVMNTDTKKGYSEIVLAVGLWGLNSGVTARLINVSSFLFYPLASLFGLLIVAGELLRRKRILEVFVIDQKLMLLLVGLLIFLNNSSFYYAIQNTTIANAVLLHYLAPLLVVLVAPTVIREEKRSRKKLAIAAVGLLGMFVILSPQAEAINIGIIAGLASAVFYASHTLIEKRLTTSVEPLIEVFYKNSVAAALSVMAIPIIISQGLFSLEEMAKIAFLGITALGIGFILFFRGLGRVSSQNAMVLTYLEAVIAIVLGSIVFGEAMKLNVVFGGLLIVGSGIAIIKMRE